jgi:predicted Zn-dependent peptidase
MTALEDINSRAQVMMRIYSQGKTWNDYLADLRRIDEITRDDVVRVANKYFTDNYLCATKSTGKYGKDDLPKPDLDPIRPKHSEESSSFAKELESISVGKVEHRFLDFDKDTHRVKLAESVNLFVTSNNINDIFTFDIYFAAGSLQHPAAGILANYLQYIGTENASYSEFQYKLQSVGSTMTFDSAKDWFVIRITGFDAYFEQTLRLMREFMTEAKADDKKLKPIVDEAKIAEKTFFKSSQNVAAAIMEKVRYGEESRFLRKLSLSETKKLKGETLLSLFKEMQSVARDYHYCGTLDSSVVEKAIKDIFPSDGIDKDSVSPYFRPYIRYDKPVVYFYNMPDASQSVILTSVLGDEMKDYRQRCAGRLFSIYFGGDMSSLMFQEIREYRSLAYMANGRVLLPSVTDKEPLFSFSTTMSTQCDKTLDAMSVLSNLIEYMPLKPERFQYIKQVALNSMHSNYPTFREVSERIANLRAQGFEEDPKLILFRNLETMSMDDVNDFYLGNVKGRIPVYVVVGNKKKIDMKKLSAYGKIINLKKKDIYN